MLTLEDIKNNLDLINAIDWNITPEEAVTLYLEWGNNWSHGNYVIRSKQDVSHYFVINYWQDRPIIYLIRRNSEEAKEIAQMNMPPDLEKQFVQAMGKNKGVYAIDGSIKQWLKQTLSIN
ncbi:MAG: hypothetical protein HQK77_17900 [Desulfobacterales bacterium]|nr:hypothetical protein [Desulfobacterales bacterium]